MKESARFGERCKRRAESAETLVEFSTNGNVMILDTGNCCFGCHWHRGKTGIVGSKVGQFWVVRLPKQGRKNDTLEDMGKTIKKCKAKNPPLSLYLLSALPCLAYTCCLSCLYLLCVPVPPWVPLYWSVPSISAYLWSLCLVGFRRVSLSFYSLLLSLVSVCAFEVFCPSVLSGVLCGFSSMAAAVSAGAFLCWL